MPDIPDVTYSGTTGARIVFTQLSLQALFDDLYSASWVEREVEKKWPGKAPKREVVHPSPDASGDKKNKKYYVYDVCEPLAAFLEALFPNGANLWLKLWRDMVWNTLRVQPATRKVYEQSANGKPSSQAKEFWNAFIKPGHGGINETNSLSGSLFIGAQATNEENVEFKGHVRDNLLLHFWTIASLVFVPNELDRAGKQKDLGYAIVLAQFLQRIPQVNMEIHHAGRKPDLSKWGEGYTTHAQGFDIALGLFRVEHIPTRFVPIPAQSASFARLYASLRFQLIACLFPRIRLPVFDQTFGYPLIVTGEWGFAGIMPVVTTPCKRCPLAEVACGTGLIGFYAEPA